MNSFQALRRLEAWREGRALPRGETLHFPMAADGETLVLAFVRMGGESSPWGIAWGRPGDLPRIGTVPEPRNRDMVADLVTSLAPRLLAHVFHPDHSDIEVFDPEGARPLRQLWLPNESHVDMLHHLAYAYTFAKTGDPGRVSVLNAMGRATGWLFREFNRPGQVAVIAASAALRESFTFPCEDARQAHLGYLLAWLEARGTRNTRLAAAAEAERRSISTTLTPAVERDELVQRVGAYGAARESGRRSDLRRLESEISGTLERELTHRFDLTVAAIDRLRADRRPCNAGVNKLIEAGWSAQWWEYLRIERSLLDDPGASVFISSPETDWHPSQAARSYFTQQAFEERRASLLLQNDVEMQAEAVAAGEAIHGTILAVRNEGSGRVTTPVWEIEGDGEAPTKLRKDSDVLVARTGRCKGVVRDIETQRQGAIVTLEITTPKTQPVVPVGKGLVKVTDRRLVGMKVVLLPATAEGIHGLKRRKLWEPEAPGAWLTDSRPAGRKAHAPAEVAGPVELPEEPDERDV